MFVEYKKTRDLIEKIFCAYGFSLDESREIVDAFLAADLAGADLADAEADLTGADLAGAFFLRPAPLYWMPVFGLLLLFFAQAGLEYCAGALPFCFAVGVVRSGRTRQCAP